MADCCNHKKKVRSDEEKKAIASRLNRIAGQINGIQKMVEEDRYCDDVLTQLAAVDKAVKSLAGLILSAHMHTCLVEQVQAGDTQIVDEVVELFKRFQ
ncbi:MAG: metal-sensing transcriptional repressor [Clostridia bacterium]|nr:metal-sensing transcriptional repressor [Clostridia bacterium]MDE6676782.1 metal-sensing transcriptional repressor [Clostridia bacterium]